LCCSSNFSLFCSPLFYNEQTTSNFLQRERERERERQRERETDEDDDDEDDVMTKKRENV